jgi:hypothetical protein
MAAAVAVSNVTWAVPWLRRLAAGLPPRRPGFDPRSVHVGFVVDKVALGQVFPPEFFGFPLSISFHRCSITRKRTTNNHHLHRHHRVAQEASRMRGVRSVCCGALQHLKKKCRDDMLTSTVQGVYLLNAIARDEILTIFLYDGASECCWTARVWAPTGVDSAASTFGTREARVLAIRALKIL